MAGFAVSINGWIWVSTEGQDGHINFDYADAIGKKFHILALVFLAGEADRLDLDQSEIFLLVRDDITKGYYTLDEVAEKRMTFARVDDLFRRQLRAV